MRAQLGFGAEQRRQQPRAGHEETGGDAYARNNTEKDTQNPASPNTTHVAANSASVKVK
jgi:hypothetical protein